MRKLTKASRNQTCTIRLPGICSHDPEKTVPCHVSGIRFGHGVGQKVPDILVADGCSECHSVVDGRVKVKHLTKEQIRLAFYEGVLETILRRVAAGLVKV